jgi:hypothetical protein
MKKIALFLVALSLFTACKVNKEVIATVTVKNTLDIDRNFETVEVDISDLAPKKVSNLVVLDSENKSITSQIVDTDLDGKNDVILFQPSIKANQSQNYRIAISATKKEVDTAYCFSRFVPERTDDYAWENNRVALRTFGPVAQQMKEDGIKGGTLSSGLDAWLKRVEYPIINKWYKETTEGKGSYHKDTGEGLDNFHVGVSRGVGGIAAKVDTSYYFSKNFNSYKTITSGPIRTSFVLTYADWDANGKQITETKHISLDYGQNLSRFEIDLNGTDVISAGLTLHKKDGKISQNKNWISYWEPFDDSELGQGLLSTDTYFINSEKYNTSKKDESNLFANLRVVDNKVVYYSGFGWKKSNQFKNEEAWKSYLADFLLKINNPLLISLN